MILYHGSNTKVTDIDLTKCRTYKDFGKGFYLTDIREQAEQMARRVVRLYGGAPCLSAFDFDETALSAGGVQALVFNKPNKDWALFVLNNRNRKFNNLSDPLCNRDNKYDIVTGPVANDDIAYLFREGTTQDIIAYLVEDKNITVEQAMDTVYNSDVFAKLSDKEIGLYRESPAYVAALLKDELVNGRFTQIEV